VNVAGDDPEELEEEEEEEVVGCDTTVVGAVVDADSGGGLLAVDVTLPGVACPPVCDAGDMHPIRTNTSSGIAGTAVCLALALATWTS
jgi:hypothetical protein